MNISSIEQRNCTGCKMCGDICPTNAINYKLDNQGFWYPVVDEGKCIDCGICEKRCPSLHQDIFEMRDNVPSVYALWSKDDAVRISSTSGGVFWEFALDFIRNGGVVAGSVYGSDWKSAHHMIATTAEELERVKGSKYFQSDTGGIYKKIKAVIKEGKKLLFCGTPCQNAALYSFLGEEYSEKILFMDFICRSINSPKAFKAYIDELEEQYNSKVIEVHLKNKNNGWHSLASQVRFENGSESIKDKDSDWWVKGFIYNDLYTRESCFDCKYKTLPRKVADITIGDFWGIKGQKPEDEFKGISVMLVNTKKGEKAFETVKEKFVYQEHELKDVLPGNPALVRNPVKSLKQEKFFTLLKDHSFSYSVNKLISVSFLKKIKRFLGRVLSRIYNECKYWSRINILQYIYYNYFCKNIVRKDKSKVIPYKGTVLDLSKKSRIYLSGRNLEITTNKLKHSRAETHIRMNGNAVWNCNNGGYLFYNTVLEIKDHAIFDSGYFSANGGSVIIAHKHITFGEDVMIGRNVIVYDSDFHKLKNKYEQPINLPKDVYIGDHVWLTSNIIVQKGVTIGKDSLIAAYTTINRDVPEHSIVGGKSSGKVITDYVNWDRQAWQSNENNVWL